MVSPARRTRQAPSTCLWGTGADAPTGKLAVDRDMMTTGSVRGKFASCRPGTRAPARRRNLGQRAAIEQKRRRACQCISAFADPSIAGLPGRDQAAGGNRAQVDEFEIIAARDDENPPVEKAVARVRLLLDRLVGQGARRKPARRPARGRGAPRRARRPAFRSRSSAASVESAPLLEEQRHVAGDQNRACVIAGAEARDLVWRHPADRKKRSSGSAAKPSHRDRQD